MSGSISNRLKKIADFVSTGSNVADIGADHGKLLVYLAEQGKLSSGIAGELNVGPAKNVANFVKRMGWLHLIDIRLGDGLSVIQDDPIDVVVIAGMGGALITDILETGQVKLRRVRRLILQANIGENRVRQWLDTHHWSLVAEEIIYEDGIYYEIIVAEPSKQSADVYERLPLEKERFYQIGPLLWRDHHPLLPFKLRLAIERKQAVLKQLSATKEESAKEKRMQMEAEIIDFKQVIEWLLVEKN